MAEATDPSPDIPPLLNAQQRPLESTKVCSPSTLNILTFPLFKPSHTSTSSAFSRRSHSGSFLFWSSCVALFVVITNLLIAPASASVLPASPLVNHEPHSLTADPYQRNPSPLAGNNLKLSIPHTNSFPPLDPTFVYDRSQQDALDLIERLLALEKRDIARSSTLPKRRSLVARQNGSDTARPSATSCSLNEESGLKASAKAGYAIVVPILVVLSGIFAGLTLGYMSLDETQLQVLATTGSAQQKAYAKKIIPIRKDGHLLLTTLLIANMITNETLPIVSDPLFPSPVLAVVVSTILVIIFAELVPQSVCSRYGLEIGAYMAVPTRCIIFLLWPIGYPVSRVLHWTLGPHHGIVYRRAELKELVTMHALSGGRGGDLNGDTVMMVGGALDLQEKVAHQAMTPIDNVFMLSFDAKLDYSTLEGIVQSGHSRIPIYQEIEVPIDVPSMSGSNTPSKRVMPAFVAALTRRSTMNSPRQASVNDDQRSMNEKSEQQRSSAGTHGIDEPIRSASSATTTVKRKKIVGTLLVKSCVLLDPEDAVPVSKMTINALPSVPHDEPLPNVLNAFQEGRSHMAIVTSAPRLNDPTSNGTTIFGRTACLSDIGEEVHVGGSTLAASHQSTSSLPTSHATGYRARLRDFWRKRANHDGKEDVEQQVYSTSAEKIVPAANARSISPEILGIITLEDVLEEIIGEEIYDEYDPREDGGEGWNKLTPPASPSLATNDPPVDGDAKQNWNLTADSQSGYVKKVDSHESATPDSCLVFQGERSANMPSAIPRTLLGRLGLQSTQQRATSLSSQSIAPAPGTAGSQHAPDDATAAQLVHSPDADEDQGFSSSKDTRPNNAPRDAAGEDGLATSPLDKSRSDASPSAGSQKRNASRNPSAEGSGPPTQHSNPSRLLLLRTHLSGGATSTGSVSDGTPHRGRGLVNRGLSLSAAAGGGMILPSGHGGSATTASTGEGPSRSTTPKPNRFKSAPVNTPSGSCTLATASASASASATMPSRPLRTLSRDVVSVLPDVNVAHQQQEHQQPVEPEESTSTSGGYSVVDIEAIDKNPE